MSRWSEAKRALCRECATPSSTLWRWRSRRSVPTPSGRTSSPASSRGESARSGLPSGGGATQPVGGDLDWKVRVYVC